MDRARNAFGWVRDIVGILAILLLPLVAWAWKTQELRIDEAKAEAVLSRRELMDFEKWHAETMIRKDYLDAKFGAIQEQFAAVRELMEANPGREAQYRAREQRYIKGGGK